MCFTFKQHGHTALYWAAYHCNINTTALLLEAKADTVEGGRELVSDFFTTDANKLVSGALFYRRKIRMYDLMCDISPCWYALSHYYSQQSHMNKAHHTHLVACVTA